MFLDDRFFRGYIAGLVGGVVMTLINQLTVVLGLVSIRLIDWVGMIFLGYVPATVGEQLLCLTIQLVHAAVVGILFAYLVTDMSSRYLILKGSTIGAITWFIIFGVGSLFKVPLYFNLSWVSVSANLFAASIWGVTAALVLLWFEQHATAAEKSCRPPIIAAPACKYLPEEPDGEMEDLLEQQKLLLPPEHKKIKRHRSFWSRLKFW